MISTRNIISKLEDIPIEWVFEFYLNLSEKLTGQSIKIKSIFNSLEKTPSMYIYLDGNSVYKYKDFSSGFAGDALSLVQNLFNLSRGAASFRIIEDYNNYIKINGISSVKKIETHSRYVLTDYEMRHWNNFDQMYWKQYFIGSKMLEFYNVAPLAYYTLTKTDNLGIQTSIRITTNHMYGFFKNDGTLYKVYQPKTKDNKFIKVRDYIQGSEQLTGKKKFLIITSSLKDLMVFNKLQINDAECIAPDSENSMIPSNYIKNAINHYQKVIILFDNDQPGINAATKYQELYGLPYVVLPMEKDLSDSVKEHGIDSVRSMLIPLLKQVL